MQHDRQITGFADVNDNILPGRLSSPWYVGDQSRKGQLTSSSLLLVALATSL